MFDASENKLRVKRNCFYCGVHEYADLTPISIFVVMPNYRSSRCHMIDRQIFYIVNALRILCKQESKEIAWLRYDIEIS